ncbi:MAG: rod shape-determining protein MreD [Candidatus Eisenbacteria bacterium]|nr:rod shape-determining protein MreD [Candidatus Eisenbacteria bacterium]
MRKATQFVRWVGLILAALLLAALQGTLGLIVPWEALRPDLLLGFLVLAAMDRGPRDGVWLGFILGLVADLDQPTLLGMNALISSALGYAAGRAAEAVDRSSIMVQGLFIVALGAAGRATEALIIQILEGYATWGRLLQSTLPEVLVTAFLVPMAVALWSATRRQPARR